MAESERRGATAKWLVTGTLALALGVAAGIFAAIVTAGKKDFADRRALVEQMDVGQKHELLRQRDHFLRLSVDDQQRLRMLHRELEDSPHAAELRRVMNRYYAWSKTSLNTTRRYDLLDRDVADRVARIKEIKRGQDYREKTRLSAAPTAVDFDFDAYYTLIRWLKEYGREHQKQIDEIAQQRGLPLRPSFSREGRGGPGRRGGGPGPRGGIPNDDQRALARAKRRRDDRNLIVIWSSISRGPQESARLPVPTLERLDELAKELPEGPQHRLLDKADAAGKWDELRSMIHAVALHPLPLPQVSDEELLTTLEAQKDDRLDLIQHPWEELKFELLYRHFASQYPELWYPPWARPWLLGGPPTRRGGRPGSPRGGPGFGRGGRGRGPQRDGERRSRSNSQRPDPPAT